MAFGVSRLFGGRLGGLSLLVLSRFTRVKCVCQRHSTRSPGLVALTTVVGGLGRIRPVLVSGLHGLGDPGVF
jgi:hypothetical protein